MTYQLGIDFDRRRGHYAKVENSPRLRRVLDVLDDGEWHSTFDIMSRTQLCAVGSAVSELRANGLDIESRCVGQGKYEYRLRGEL